MSTVNFVKFIVDAVAYGIGYGVMFFCCAVFVSHIVGAQVSAYNMRKREAKMSRFVLSVSRLPSDSEGRFWYLHSADTEPFIAEFKLGCFYVDGSGYSEKLPTPWMWAEIKYPEIP